MSQGLLNMWISFIAIALMFISVATAIFSREKLKGWIQKMVLTFSFVCLLVSGIIVLIIVVGGPTPSM